MFPYQIENSASQSRPEVSVVIPVHNGGKLLLRAVDSVLAQTETNYEIIIVDDGSTDDTWETISKYSLMHPFIRGIRHARSKRAPAASNAGIDAARGRWIAILDHDDWYHPQRLRALIEVGEKEHADLVADNQFFFDAQANVIYRTALPERPGHRTLTLKTLLENALTGVPSFDYGMLKPLFRTEFLRRTGVRYLQDCYEGYDFHILLDVLANDGKASLVTQAYYFYTVPFGPLSRRTSYQDKKVYDYSRMQRFSELAANQYGGRLLPSEIALLRKRVRCIASYSKYLNVKAALKQRTWSQGFEGLLDYRVWAFAWYALKRRLMTNEVKCAVLTDSSIRVQGAVEA